MNLLEIIICILLGFFIVFTILGSNGMAVVMVALGGLLSFINDPDPLERGKGEG